jgi:hypothetical protein
MFYSKAIIDDVARIRVYSTDNSIFITLISNQNYLNNHGKYVNTFDLPLGASANPSTKLGLGNLHYKSAWRILPFKDLKKD